VLLADDAEAGNDWLELELELFLWYRYFNKLLAPLILYTLQKMSPTNMYNHKRQNN